MRNIMIFGIMILLIFIAGCSTESQVEVVPKVNESKEDSLHSVGEFENTNLKDPFEGMEDVPSELKKLPLVLKQAVGKPCESRADCDINYSREYCVNNTLHIEKVHPKCNEEYYYYFGDKSKETWVLVNKSYGYGGYEGSALYIDEDGTWIEYELDIDSSLTDSKREVWQKNRTFDFRCFYRVKTTLKVNAC